MAHNPALLPTRRTMARTKRDVRLRRLRNETIRASLMGYFVNCTADSFSTLISLLEESGRRRLFVTAIVYKSWFRGGTVSSRTLYRIAAVLILLLALGHSAGYPWSDPAWGVDLHAIQSSH